MTLKRRTFFFLYGEIGLSLQEQSRKKCYANQRHISIEVLQLMSKKTTHFF